MIAQMNANQAFTIWVRAYVFGSFCYGLIRKPAAQIVYKGANVKEKRRNTRTLCLRISAVNTS